MQQHYNQILIEAAGGLMVPLNFDMLTIEYIRERHYPVVLVTSGKLGSINHTLLSLFACAQYGIKILAVIYNQYPKIDAKIEENTYQYLERYISQLPRHATAHPTRRGRGRESGFYEFMVLGRKGMQGLCIPFFGFISFMIPLFQRLSVPITSATRWLARALISGVMLSLTSLRTRVITAISSVKPITGRMPSGIRSIGRMK